MIRVAFLFVAVGLTLSAQFKLAAPAPYPPAVARQKIRMLLESGDPDKHQKTTETLSGLLDWYRDIVDEELIAAWSRGDNRAELAALMPLYADSRVALAIVEFSWHEQRASTFSLMYAPMLGDLMARYRNSAEPFIRDLVIHDPVIHDLAGPAAGGGQLPELSPSEAEAVCRILLDMPDTGDWKKIALQVLPHYRAAAQKLLVQDFRGDDKEKSYRAQVWMGELKLDVPGVTSEERDRGPRLISRSSAGESSRPVGSPVPSETFGGRPHIVEQPSASVGSSGTLKCVGDPVPPNGEYVFPGMPLGNLQIELDGKPWGARLTPGKGQTQDLILINRGSGAQKGCTVRWRVIP